MIQFIEVTQTSGLKACLSLNDINSFRSGADAITIVHTPTHDYRLRIPYSEFKKRIDEAIRRLGGST